MYPAQIKRHLFAAALAMGFSHSVVANQDEYRGAWLHKKSPEKSALIAPIDRPGIEMLDKAASIRGDVVREDDAKRDLRIESMKAEARAYGVRSGLYWRHQKIEALLESMSPEVDQIFHFGPLMQEGVMLPPVVTQFDDGFRLENPSLARATTKAYRIEHDARIVATTPTWRDFLLRTYAEPELPAEAIWPQDDDEALIWDREVRSGWVEGVEKADAIFDASLALLTRTYKGMVTYLELVRSGVISKPVLVKTAAGIVIEGKSLDIGSVIYRLDDQSEFQSPRNWKALRMEQANVLP